MDFITKKKIEKMYLPIKVLLYYRYSIDEFYANGKDKLLEFFSM